MNDVSVIAQLNIDVLYSGFGDFPRLGEEVLSKNFDIQLGGGPQVIPLVLSRMGLPTRLGIFYTEDTQSWLGRRLLEEQGYTSYTNLYRGKGHPVVVTSVFSFPGDRSFIGYNEGVCDGILSDEETYRFLKGARVCFAPSSPAVLRRLRDDGVKLLFDTGWHEDLCIEKYRDILRFVDVFTPNDKEALKMTGAPDVRTALRILADVVRHPIVKVGKRGCLTLEEGRIVEVGAVDAFKAVDTTGAGDNFLAGIAYGLYQGWDIQACMKMGNILGGWSTTQLGCLKAALTEAQALGYMRYYKTAQAV